MFGIGFGEMLVIAVILLIAVGPRQLPSLMKTVGKGIREVRKASGDLRRTVGIDQMLADDDLRDPLRNKTPARHKLTPADLERESPPEGVDVAALRQKTEESARVLATSATVLAAEPVAAPDVDAAADPTRAASEKS